MKYFVLILALVAMSCKKDEPQNQIIGKWQFIGTEYGGKLTPSSDTYYYIFSSDNNMTIINHDGTSYNCKYEFQGDILYIDAYGAMPRNTFYIINPDKLYLWSGGNTKNVYQRI